MRSAGALFFSAALASGVLGGCSARSSAAPQAADAGSIPPSAYAQCDPATTHDAAAFTFAAACAAPGSDGGPSPSCAQWSESPDGDWSPFVDGCGADGGAISSVPCPATGVSGVCTYPATCTTQTTAFYYGAAAVAAGKGACAAAGGSFSP